MKTGISKLLLLWMLAIVAHEAVSQPVSEDARYERVSLCQFMVSYPHKVYYREIEQEFKSIPFPNRYNNHSLGVNFVKFADDTDDKQGRIAYFLADASVAKKCVAKWFGRTKTNGVFNLDLLKERGFYNATVGDVAYAGRMARGEAYLADRGERLLNYTFVAVHDMEPGKDDRNKGWRLNKESNYDVRDTLRMNDSIALARYNKQFHSAQGKRKSYEINCTTYLYRLVWNDSIAGMFYEFLYTNVYDEARKKAFDHESGLFRFEFVGSVTERLVQHRNKHINSNEQLVKTAVARVIDKNLASLQRICPDFRIKASLVSSSPLMAYVGLKEDIKPETRLEALERVENPDGTLEYVRVGILKPVEGKIWDNRFNAADSNGVDDNGLTATEFEQISGSELYPGLVLRELLRED